MDKKIIWILAWIVALTTLATISVSIFEYKPSFPYAYELIDKFRHRWLTTWAQFDGVHYLTIISKGYEGTGLIQAFFPLYPLVVKFLSLNGLLNPVVVGMMVSITSFIAAIYFLIKLLILDENESVIKKSMILLLVFPTSFFFMAVYSESLFFMLTIMSFYWARKRKWWLAGMCGLLAGTTRLVGIFLVPALAYEFWLQNKKVTTKIMWSLGPTLGLLMYMVYLWKEFGDPLLFYHVQAEFGSGRSDTALVLLPQVYYRYIKMLLTTNVSNPIFPILLQELMVGIGGLVGLIVAWFKLRKSYVLFGLGAFLLPTLTGTFSSLSRYVLPIFPLYVVAAKYLPKKLFAIIAMILAGMLVYNVIRFTQGMWVG